MKARVHFEELVKYTAEVVVEDNQELDDDGWFSAVQAQHPDWVKTCCAGVIERNLLDIENVQQAAKPVKLPRGSLVVIEWEDPLYAEDSPSRKRRAIGHVFGDGRALDWQLESLSIDAMGGESWRPMEQVLTVFRGMMVGIAAGKWRLSYVPKPEAEEPNDG